jgi:hypothetical protein
MVLDSQTQTISLIRQDQRGTQLSLAPDLGRLRDAEQKADLERQATQAERDVLGALHVESLADA